MSKKVIFHVTYSVDQLSGTLLWSARTQTGESMVPESGPHAGSLHMEHGDQVFVQIRGSGPLGQFLEASVEEAYFIAVPRGSGKERSQPSPFSGSSAVVMVPGWTKPQTSDDAPNNLRYCQQTTDVPMPVTQSSGGWQLSLVVSLAIYRSVGSGQTTASQSVRVYACETETEVGTGTGP